MTAPAPATFTFITEGDQTVSAPAPMVNRGPKATFFVPVPVAPDAGKAPAFFVPTEAPAFFVPTVRTAVADLKIGENLFPVRSSPSAPQPTCLPTSLPSCLFPWPPCSAPSVFRTSLPPTPAPRPSASMVNRALPPWPPSCLRIEPVTKKVKTVKTSPYHPELGTEVTLNEKTTILFNCTNVPVNFSNDGKTVFATLPTRPTLMADGELPQESKTSSKVNIFANGTKIPAEVVTYGAPSLPAPADGVAYVVPLVTACWLTAQADPRNDIYVVAPQGKAAPLEFFMKDGAPFATNGLSQVVRFDTTA